MRTPGRLGIGMVGYAFMGAAHSQGWRNARSFFDPALTPDLVAIGGRDAAAAADVARRFDWQHVETDWRALIARDDVDLVDICTPGDTHAEIAIAALEAGKHVLCEKPLANTVAEARAMAAAAERARAHGIRSMVGFTYRRVPAIALARQLVQEGRVGEIRHVRAQYLQDWLVDPESPLTWRLQKDRAGSGALGDTGAHIIDLDPLHHRASGSRASARRPRPSSRSGRCPARARACRPRWAPGAAGSPSTTRRSSSPGSVVGRSRPSRPPASRPAARTRSGWRSTVLAAASPSTSRT